MNDFYRWQVGDVRITRVQELEAPGMRFLLPDASPENLAPIPWLAPFLDERGHALGSIHSLILEVDDRRILVDTCIGNDKDRGRMKLWSQRKGPFLDHLAEAGFPAETIDTVVCTHLHVDHVGWNTSLVDGKWIPTFPNARYVLGRTEWDFWKDEPDEYGPVIDDSVRPIFEADLVDLVDVDHVVASGIQLESTPGHTPGHVSVHVSSRGEEAVVTGDLVHHPCQFAHPDWDDTADWNAEMALATRLDFMARYAGTPTLIIGTHFAGPTAGHIVQDGEVYRLDV